MTPMDALRRVQQSSQEEKHEAQKREGIAHRAGEAKIERYWQGYWHHAAGVEREITVALKRLEELKELEKHGT